ncbi:type II secretion system protein [Candidatus Microgenomates bacterium]|nr:type II secretion system protein [Candidatus Microgenomates bacterium]
MKSSPTTSATGFSLVEIAVGIAVIGLIIVALSDLLITVTGIQRQNRNLALATRTAEQKIESLRNSHYNSLAVSPPPLDFTAELPAELATPRTAQVNISEPTPGMKRLDVTITYQEGSRAKSVALSALIGNIGISQ